MKTGMGFSRSVAMLCALALAVTLGAERVDAGSPKDKARAPAAELELERTFRVRGTGTDIFRYRQVVDGIEVLDASAIVARGRSDQRVIGDSTESRVRRPGRARVTRAEAKETATDTVGARKLREKTTARLAIAKRGGGTLVWLVQVASSEPLGDFRVLVDAHAGGVLSKINLIRHADGEAQIYDPNPVVQDPGVDWRDRRDRDYPALTNERIPLTLANIEDGQTCLQGDWAEARSGLKRRRVCSNTPDLDWTGATRSSSRFEALMAYFHVDRMQEYVQSLDLGVGINDRRQVINASSFTADNAFYAPFSRKISLGTGGVDDGEDADIIIHEYGHAIQDAQEPGFGVDNVSRAMGEGFGDYLAAVASRELSGSTADQATCIFEWDATSYSPPCGRTARNQTASSPSCQSFDIHCKGQVWAGALFELRELFGDDIDGYNVMDSIVLLSHEYLDNPSPSFQVAVAALLEADDDLYGGFHNTAISDEMEARGLIPG